MFNWTILYSGNPDLMHVAISTAAFLGVDAEWYRRFDGTPDKKATLINYLSEKKSDSENTIDMAIHDRMCMKRFHRFSYPDYFFIQGYVKGFLQLDMNILVLPSKKIPTDGAERCYGPIYRGQIAIDVTECALLLSPIGAKILYDSLTNDNPLSEMYFFSEKMIDFYQWEYGENDYD